MYVTLLPWQWVLCIYSLVCLRLTGAGLSMQDDHAGEHNDESEICEVQHEQDLLRDALL